MASRRRSIRVGVRLRPAAGAAAWRVDGSAVVERPRADAYASQQRAPRVFRFDDVFDVRADNTAVYEQVAKDVVDDALRGNSGALIAYGQTASGKTHTMQGTPESPGLIPAPSSTSSGPIKGAACPTSRATTSACATCSATPMI